MKIFREMWITGKLAYERQALYQKAAEGKLPGSVHAVVLPGGECRQAHRAGIEVNTWTVNAEADIRKVLAEGADIVISNHPDRAVRCRREAAEE